MTERRLKCALTGLKWTLALVILIEAVLFVMPGARHDFGRTHMPDIVRQVLGWSEIVGAVLLLIPKTTVPGACILLVTFVLAIVIHLLHGAFNVGALAVYVTAAWAVAAGKGTSFN